MSLVRAHVIVTGDAIYEHPSYAELGEEEKEAIGEMVKEAVYEAMRQSHHKWQPVDDPPRVTFVVMDGNYGT